MNWSTVWTLTRKDLAEFRRQKLVVGSIFAMPLFLGVVLPLVTFLPLVAFSGPATTWDVEGLQQYGSLPENATVPVTTQAVSGSYNGTVLRNLTLINATVSKSCLLSCVVQNSTVDNSTLYRCAVERTSIDNGVLSHTTGENLSGQHIITVDSDVSFAKTKPSEAQQFFPSMVSLILMVFIIVPATLPTIIASYSIVGEKNNRSLEPLLATPITDGELLAGKILSAFIPSMGATLIAFALGVVLIDVLFIPQLGMPLLPNLTWMLAILLLAPTACLMSILGCVIISSKVSDVRAAQQVGGFIVMPVVVLMLGVLSGFLLLSPLTVLAFTGIYAAIDLVLFYFARAIFNREEILTTWK